MTIWIDAHLSPHSLARWITDTFGIPAQAVRDLGLREAKDFRIFQAARDAGAIVLTKDADFQHCTPQLFSEGDEKELTPARRRVAVYAWSLKQIQVSRRCPEC